MARRQTSAMDPLRGGSRLGRLPPRLAGKALGLRCGPRLLGCVQVIVLTGAMTVAAPAAASAATYHAGDTASLQAAVASADAGSGASTIELSGGEFLPTSTLRISRDLTIVGPSSAPGAKLSGGSVSPFPSDLLLVEANGKLTLSNVELTTAGGEGSAAAIDDFGSVDLESSTVAGNSGPGLLVQVGAAATIRNSTLSDGLDLGVVDNGTASFINSTVAFNKGGGVYDTGGALSLTNTIVAENGSSDCTKRATASDHSLDSDGSCGVGALSRTDPLLAKGLRNNGGPTQTHALEAGSPAIGAGDDSKCSVEDQRHFARPLGRCDIGAYETGAVQGGAGTAPSGTGGGSNPSVGGATGAVVSGHGALRGARRSRITFTVRAEVGHSSATFLYSDGARHLVLRKLTVRSLAIDGRRGVATLRGSGETSSRRRVGVTVVLVSHSRQRSLRIRLSSGYHASGRLITGSITFVRGAGER